MTDSVISFDGVSKKFSRGSGHTSLRDLLPALGRGLLRRRKSTELQQQEFWAVRDVSFNVTRGNALGIIGPNGAGKSTTLKLLTKIMRPDLGRCQITGRTGALIELAAGFHPDLSGRENVFLQGAIMGMKRADIVRKLDDILAFSGLGEFIDTPVKRYSSGMNARLGFSIAANLEPDALVIDEVLAVGDMAFQQRCIERMQEFKRNGVAIVFVSHNLQAISSLCTQALFLAGSVKAVGDPESVIQAYVESSEKKLDPSLNDAVPITAALLLDENGEAGNSSVTPGTLLVFRVDFMPTVAAADVTFSVLVYRSTDNLLLYDGHFTNADIQLPAIKAGEPFQVDFRFRANLTRGHYRIMVRLEDNVRREFLAQVCPSGYFGVEELQSWAGIVHMDVRPELRRIPSSSTVS
jgi:lipopolysaccharide transport system ATP-binding protein